MRQGDQGGEVIRWDTFPDLSSGLSPSVTHLGEQSEGCLLTGRVGG